MRPRHTSPLLALALLACASLPAQMPKQMKEIKGGTRIVGGGYQYRIEEWRMHLLTTDEQYSAMNSQSAALGEVPSENNIELQVSVSDFYLSETEVTNLEYRNFLLDSLVKGKDNEIFRKALKAAAKDQKSTEAQWQKLFSLAEEKGLMPQLDVWESDFPNSYNKPLTTHYFSHPSFDNYPVVGVSWDQANAFCKWLSSTNNAARAKKGLPLQPDFRLPTEMEWEHAALGPVPTTHGGKIAFDRIYPWEGSAIQDAQGKFLANMKVDNGDYIGDNYEYTAPVRSFPANGFGLYDMGGNVSEWTMDSFILRNTDSKTLKMARPAEDASALRVIKGGSWADYKYAVMCGSRAGMEQSKGFSRVGFRVAMTKTSDEM